jgi:hypothetical protein
MKKFRAISAALLLTAVLFTAGCDTGGKDDDSKILMLLLMLSSSVDYGTISFNDGSGVVTLNATSPWEKTTSGPTFYEFVLSSGGRILYIVVPIASMGVAGPYTEDSATFIFSYNNGLEGFSDQAGHDFTFSITAVTGNRVQGTFSGELSNGATNITITDGTFDLAYE